MCGSGAGVNPTDAQLLTSSGQFILPIEMDAPTWTRPSVLRTVPSADDVGGLDLVELPLECFGAFGDRDRNRGS